MSRMLQILIFVFLCTICCVIDTNAFMPIDYAIDAYAVPSTSLPIITLYWKADSNKTYFIERKEIKNDQPYWKQIHISYGNNTFTDTLPESSLGKQAEYRIKSQLDDYYYAYGYVSTATGYFDTDRQENLLLLVDDYVYANIKTKIDAYKKLFIADGYNTILRTVPRPENFDSNAVKYTKRLIDSINQILPLSYITILGHVAVPYSGYDAIDGHPDHIGAWPCDAFYVQFHDRWSDTIVDAHSAVDIRNRNVPGDGKYDQLFVYDSIKIAIGRIDFSNLSDLSKPELELYSDYIDRISSYKHGNLALLHQGLIVDGFGTDYQEMLATEGWQNSFSLFGTDSTFTSTSLIPSLIKSPCFYVYACNSGSYNSIKNQLYSQNIDTADFACGIISLMGSYLGDWDSENNILRCLVAHSALNSFFGGRPFWRLEDLNLGLSVGKAYLKSINNSNFYTSTNLYGFKMLHIALMGDPTVRMLIVPPATSFNVETTDYGNELSWSMPSEYQNLKANIFKAIDIDSPFVKINAEPLEPDCTKYTDINGGNAVYMLRLLSDYKSYSGNIIRGSSIGIFASAKSDVAESFIAREIELRLRKGTLEIYSPNSITDIVIYDINFRQIKAFQPYSCYTLLNLNDLYHGIYFIKMKVDNNMCFFKKIVI